MSIHLVASAGPLVGRRFTFDNHDVFLLDRSKTMHSQLGDKEKYVSRIQFLIEINPPRCRVLDFGNPSGTFVNGKRISSVELRHLDEIRAGHTYFRLENSESRDDFGIPRTETGKTPAPRGRTPEIPGYQLEKELGRGPLGSVYQALREADEAAVAIKTITPAVAPSREQAIAFLNDAAGLRKLEHTHIVQLHDLGMAAGIFWFAMDLVQGPNLEQLLKERGKMDEKVAVRIVLHVLSALEHAHENGIGHSDLKLSNVFLEEQLDKKRTVKVSDFGLAHAYAITPMSGLTLTDHIGPAVECIAPEQITHFRGVTTAADQFRAAVMLYRMLTDKSPYYSPSPANPLAQILDGAIVPLRSRRHELPAELSAVVERALAREPAERYPDVQTFAEALRPFAK